jgi:NAD-dependent DNA ligase
MKPAIIDIPGIGPAAAKALAEHGIRTLANLSRASVKKIASVPGFSEARATQVIADAAELLTASGITPSAKEKESGKKDKGKKDKKKKGKDKKDKKGKGKGKGKKKGKK